ncbi:MAG: YIP1 family protein [Sandaracinaceae bacterium]|nr:YIP1 family protein [Sandaracinaceae bacterium]
MNAAAETTEEALDGATCGTHEVAATFVCTRCGDFGCAECLFSSVKDKSVCTRCAAKGLGEPIPWERRKELGTTRAFWRTCKAVMSSPARFFRTPTTQDGVMMAVLHGVIAVTIGLFLSYAVAGIFLGIAGGTFAAIGDEAAQPIGALLGTYGCVIAGFSPILALMAGPANALFGQVVAAAAAHGVLALGKKTKGTFEDTLRVCSYANAPYLFTFVPLLGSFTWFWVVGLEVVGLRETHRCGTDWAAAAAIGYRVVFALLLIGGYAVLLFGFLATVPPPPTP